MTTYKCLDDIRGIKTLAKGDTVIFTKDGKQYEYKVESCYLRYPDGLNDEIFTVLGLDKRKFCENVYGYEAMAGSWPDTRIDDYPALTRAVVKLYEIIEGKTAKETYIQIDEFMGGRISLTKQTKMQKLTSTLKRILSPDLQKLYKTGLIDGNLILSEKGKEEMWAILQEKFQPELVKSAEEILADAEKE